ncbi:gas vesicle protein GvpL/GvpF [Haloactinopolyspora alba]|uniref:Gas vesicle protein GvpL/GvpF n=1 Tax=Haloactinopolyspora alba TaxID=648780 RepID=A0A2P8D3U1_9ACTN|nr:GvpL/GvpF family gas vesicle protein [Haloactinopolyspora alba]PSK91893.1 gas vesicle protein GvpL/GvpF [Haloactinopolyspora alba]
MTLGHRPRDESPAQPAAGYVYAIVPAGARTPTDLAGLDGRPVQVIGHGSVGAVVGAVRSDRTFGRRADLLAHRQVVDTFAERVPVMPVRFGSVVAGSAEIVGELLAPNVEYFADVLASLAGRRQFVVRARYDEASVLAEVVSENPDIAALRERTRELPEHAGWADRVRLGELVSAALEAKREVDGRTVLDHLDPHVAERNVRSATGVDDLIHVALLVDEERRTEFEDAAERVAAALSGRATVQLMGPAAPYDFTPEA